MQRVIATLCLTLGLTLTFGICVASADTATATLSLPSALLGFAGTVLSVIGTVLVAGMRFSGQIARGFAELRGDLAKRVSEDDCRRRHEALAELQAGLRERVSGLEAVGDVDKVAEA